MKTVRIFLLSFLLVYLPHLVCSQDYEPMAQDHNRWIVNTSDENNLSIHDLWEYFINGDTTVNGTDYYKVYYRDLLVTQNGPPYEAENDYQLFGFLRDDIENRKVYAIQLEENGNNCAPGEEVLLYDFSLTIGDTMTSCIFDPIYNNIIQNINSTTRFGYSTLYFSAVYSYYEGIGSEFGLFEMSFIPVKTGRDRQNEIPSLHRFCRQDSCSLVVSVDKPEYHSDIRISPNPANAFIHIESDTPGDIHTIIIRDMLGNEVLRKKSNNSGKIEFNTSMLSKGVYLVTVLDRNGLVRTTEKILVK